MVIGRAGSGVFFERILICRNDDKAIIEADDSLKERLESDKNDGGKNAYDQPMSEMLARSSSYV